MQSKVFRDWNLYSIVVSMWSNCCGYNRQISSFESTMKLVKSYTFIVLSFILIQFFNNPLNLCLKYKLVNSGNKSCEQKMAQIHTHIYIYVAWILCCFKLVTRVLVSTAKDNKTYAVSLPISWLY